MRWWFLVAALGAAAAIALASGCGQGCTMVGCSDGLWLDVVARCWPDGAYEVSGALDGEPFAFELVLPGPGGGGASADGRVSARIDDRFLLEIDDARSRTVELRIRRDELVVFEETWNPEYRKFRPNGEDCEPVCRVAGRETVVPSSVSQALCDLLEEP